MTVGRSAEALSLSPNTRRISLVRLGALSLVVGSYILSGKLGLLLAYVHPNVTGVWVPSGIALAAVILLGYEVWPLIFVSAFLVHLTTAGSVPISLAIAAGNTLEAVAGGWLVNRKAGGRTPFYHPENYFKFVALAAIASTLVSPSIGVTALVLGGAARWAHSGAIWVTWWLGDLTGVLVVAPAILLWADRRRERWNAARLTEAGLLFLTWLVTAELVFGGFYPSEIQNYPLEFLCIPPLLWAAFRFGPREAATGMLLLSGLAVAGTLHGFGPFVQSSQQDSLYLVQAYAVVASVTALTLASVIWERRSMEAQLRELAVTDPFTGLANYRLLLERIALEILRSKRTSRPFALLFMDLDGLKAINDRMGHLVGSRALVRVAEAMKRSCRAMDTPARYGGDEFAIVLPECDESAGGKIAQRLTDALARDREDPPITVSLGVATYPKHGETPEALLSAADRTLYAMKAARKSGQLAVVR